jgi:hypothetical protein
MVAAWSCHGPQSATVMEGASFPLAVHPGHRPQSPSPRDRRFVRPIRVYALSGLAINHIGKWDPNFKTVVTEHQLERPLPADEKTAVQHVLIGRGGALVMLGAAVPLFYVHFSGGP